VVLGVAALLSRCRRNQQLPRQIHWRRAEGQKLKPLCSFAHAPLFSSPSSPSLWPPRPLGGGGLSEATHIAPARTPDAGCAPHSNCFCLIERSGCAPACNGEAHSRIAAANPWRGAAYPGSLLDSRILGLVAEKAHSVLDLDVLHVLKLLAEGHLADLPAGRLRHPPTKHVCQHFASRVLSGTNFS
jgi:hypothetical protein